MKNNTDLVEIIYGETIQEYVIILKRFPDKPVVLNKSGFTNIYDLCNYRTIKGECIYKCICDINKTTENNDKYNTYNRLELTSNNNQDSYLNIVSKNSRMAVGCLTITNLEKFEIINKVLELRQILIEKGELNIDEY